MSLKLVAKRESSLSSSVGPEPPPPAPSAPSVTGSPSSRSASSEPWIMDEISERTVGAHALTAAKSMDESSRVRCSVPQRAAKAR